MKTRDEFIGSIPTSTFFSGENAVGRPVEITLTETTLVISEEQNQFVAAWPLIAVRDISHPGGELTLTQSYADRAVLKVPDLQLCNSIRAGCPKLRTQRRTSIRAWFNLFIGAVLAIFLTYLIVFQFVPKLSDHLANLVPVESERKIGVRVAELMANVLSDGNGVTFCTSPEGVVALSTMSSRMGRPSDLHTPLTVRVVDTTLINAYALPGGQILITRGLLEQADSPEEVAGVLAHEIGHIAARDPMRLSLRSAGIAGLFGILLGEFAGGTVLAFLSEAMIKSGYSQESETLADEFAHNLLRKRGLPSTPFAEFFEKILDDAEYEERQAYQNHFATHPKPEERIRKALRANAIIGAFEPVLSKSEWQALLNVCDL